MLRPRRGRGVALLFAQQESAHVYAPGSVVLGDVATAFPGQSVVVTGFASAAKCAGISKAGRSFMRVEGVWCVLHPARKHARMLCAGSEMHPAGRCACIQTLMHHVHPVVDVSRWP